MSDGADDFPFEGLEYAFSGGWSTPVGSLVRWLRANSCSEYAYRLEREAQSVSSTSAPGDEQGALAAIREELALLYNTPPAQLTPQQHKELNRLRHEAAGFVQYRLRQLADRHESEARAARNLGAGAAALLASIPANSIQRDGDAWKIRYGAEHGTFAVKDYSVIETLAVLLARPRHQHSLDDLVDPDTARLLAASRGKDDRLDAEGLTSLKARYVELQRDIATESDPEAKGHLQEEYGQLAAELKAAVGPGGRRRKVGYSEEDQAWDARTKALRRLWPRLRKAGLPKLANHLEQTIRIDRPHITYLPTEGAAAWTMET